MTWLTIRIWISKTDNCCITRQKILVYSPVIVNFYFFMHLQKIICATMFNRLSSLLSIWSHSLIHICCLQLYVNVTCWLLSLCIKHELESSKTNVPFCWNSSVPDLPVLNWHKSLTCITRNKWKFTYGTQSCRKWLFQIFNKLVLGSWRFKPKDYMLVRR